jgi:adenylate kinase
LPAQQFKRGTRAVILFGSPGSGKGTQARLLKEQCVKGPHISTGDMLRHHIERDDEIGRQIRELMKSGMLVPDELVNQLVADRIQAPDCAEGFILDGYPRTLNQAAMLRKLVEANGIESAVVHLVVDYDRLVARLSGRRQCPACGTLYNLATNPPRVDEKCDLEGAALVTREDDRESVIAERLSQYEHQTRPLLDYFHSSGVPMFEIKGAGVTPEAIAKDICEKLSAQRQAIP